MCIRDREQGVDLVLELPVGYALAPAEDFAYGAIATLDACGVVTDRVFGSECGDLGSLQVTAQRALNENEQERATIRRYLDEGLSHPQARAMAYGDDAGPLASPNDILGVEYLKALTRLKSPIRPHTILRLSLIHISGRGYVQRLLQCLCLFPIRILADARAPMDHSHSSQAKI